LPGGFSRFVLAKLLVTAVAVVLAAGARPAGALPRPLLLLGVAWAACFALAAVLGETSLASLLGRWPRYEGLPTLAVYAGACWVGARVTGRGPSATARLHGVVAAVAIVLAAFSLLNVAGVTPLGTSTDARSGSVLDNATDQGAVAMMAALLLAGPALGLARSRSRARAARGGPVPWLTVAGQVAAVTTVAVSGSRTALALTAFGLVVTVVVQARQARRTTSASPGGAATSRTLLAGGGVVGCLVAAALLVPTTRDRLLGLGTADGRLQQWRLTLDLVLDHPVLGLGGSRYVDAFLVHESPAFVDFTGPQRLADSPHSVVLQVLLAGGIVLLALTAAGLYVVARRVRVVLVEHPETGPAALAVTAYLALLCVNFTTAGPTCFAALLLGAVVAVPPPARDRSGAPVGAVAAALAVVLVAAAVGDVQLRRAVDAADRQDSARAGELVEQASRWRPWDVDLDVIAARVLAGEAALGDPGAAQRAEVLAREALARVPDSYESLVALGVALSAQGRLTEAEATLDRAVALAPHRPDGYVQRAIARTGLERYDDALADLDRARRILPGSPVVRRLARAVGRAQARDSD
jgi:O-antigen ligase